MLTISLLDSCLVSWDRTILASARNTINNLSQVMQFTSQLVKLASIDKITTVHVVKVNVLLICKKQSRDEMLFLNPTKSERNSLSKALFKGDLVATHL